MEQQYHQLHRFRHWRHSMQLTRFPSCSTCLCAPCPFSACAHCRLVMCTCQGGGGVYQIGGIMTLWSSIITACTALGLPAAQPVRTSLALLCAALVRFSCLARPIMPTAFHLPLVGAPCRPAVESASKVVLSLFSAAVSPAAPLQEQLRMCAIACSPLHSTRGLLVPRPPLLTTHSPAA